MKFQFQFRKTAVAVLLFALAILALGPVVALHSQSPKRGGFDVPVAPSEQWAGRRCYVSGGEAADIGIERAALNLLRITDCTDAANLRDIQARFIGRPVGSVIASATTITPTSPIHHVSGTTAIATITVPTNCTPGCDLTLVPDAIWATNTSGNVSLATTAVVNKALILTWDGAKWNPSY